MFDFDLPLWELIARGAIVYCALLAMMRVSGRRTVGAIQAVRPAGGDAVVRIRVQFHDRW